MMEAIVKVIFSSLAGKLKSFLARIELLMIGAGCVSTPHYTLRRMVGRQPTPGTIPHRLFLRTRALFLFGSSITVNSFPRETKRASKRIHRRYAHNGRPPHWQSRSPAINLDTSVVSSDLACVICISATMICLSFTASLLIALIDLFYVKTGSMANGFEEPEDLALFFYYLILVLGWPFSLK